MIREFCSHWTSIAELEAKITENKKTDVQE